MDPHSPALQSPQRDLSAPLRENAVLRKKLKHLQTVSHIFRTRIGALFKDAAASGNQAMKQLDASYQSLLSQLPPDVGTEVSPTLPPPPGVSPRSVGALRCASPLDFDADLQLPEAEAAQPASAEGRYWHQRFVEAARRVHGARHLVSADVLPPPVAPSGGRSYEVVMQSMRDDNETLRLQLNDALQRAQESDGLRHELTQTQRQLSEQRLRVQQLKEEARLAKLESSGNALDMQKDIDTLLGSLNATSEERNQQRRASEALRSEKAALASEIADVHAVVERYKRRVSQLERELAVRAKAEQSSGACKDREVNLLTEKVESGERRITDLTSQLQVFSDQVAVQMQTLQENSLHMESITQQNQSLQERMAQNDMLMDERKHFAVLLSEVQSRLNGAVDELRAYQTAGAVADQIQNLSQQVGGLEFIEGQLKQKDDMLAVKDDELQRMRASLEQYEHSVDSISSVFLQLPQSLAQLEHAVLSLDEYRAAVHDCPYLSPAEIEEKIHIRKLEVESKRRDGKDVLQQLLQQQGDTATPGLSAATIAVLSRADVDSGSERPSPHQSPQRAPAAALSDLVPAVGAPLPRPAHRAAAFKAADTEDSGRVSRADLPLLLHSVGLSTPAGGVGVLLRLIGRPESADSVSLEDFHRLCERLADDEVSGCSTPLPPAPAHHVAAVAAAQAPPAANPEPLPHSPSRFDRRHLLSACRVFAGADETVDAADLCTILHSVGQVGVSQRQMDSYLLQRGLSDKRRFSFTDVETVAADVCFSGMHLQPQPESAAGSPSAARQRMPDSEVRHAFLAFECQACPGHIDKEHLRTCVSALGLDWAPAADELLHGLELCDFDTYRRAVAICAAATPAP